eukprot:TRINITY_DN2195_c0_g1_i1.p2 TRINITY_DN2195_c0_g1~~TRINITY_DN2195_c0_g1_i1.p2  ORF type:complete len:143 (+),score=34.61 TRINITY_DN2195_c0_g1_i1:3-431(+)
MDKAVDPVIKPAPGVASDVPSPNRLRARVLLAMGAGLGAVWLLTKLFPAEVVQKSTSDAPNPGADPVKAETKPAPEEEVAILPAFVPPRKPAMTQDEERTVLQYVLDEKRKMKPKTKQEKATLDEEKALLKQLIRSNDVPSL